MKLLILGAAGDVGRRFVAEAILQNHEVTAYIRNPAQKTMFDDKVQVVIGDVDDHENLKDLAHQHDHILSALRPPEGKENLLVTLTKSILEIASEVDKRVLIVGGAASLKLPGQEETVLSAPNFLPASVVPIATACQAQYELCQAWDGANWVYMAPSAMLVPGERNGNYRLGQDELVSDEEGNSKISMEDFAAAAIEEVSVQKFTNQRFTAGY